MTRQVVLSRYHVSAHRLLRKRLVSRLSLWTSREAYRRLAMGQVAPPSAVEEPAVHLPTGMTLLRGVPCRMKAQVEESTVATFVVVLVPVRPRYHA